MITKKQILTNTEIEKDIINALKQPDEMSEASYKKMKVFILLGIPFLVVIGFFYPIVEVVFIAALLVFLIGSTVFHNLRLKKQIKQVSIKNYSITKEIVHRTSQEHYRAESGRSPKHRSTVLVSNYTIHFENGASWRVPKKVYAWHERLRSSSLGVFKSAHREDAFIVVTKKDTGEIVMAYHTELFEYKT